MKSRSPLINLNYPHLVFNLTYTLFLSSLLHSLSFFLSLINLCQPSLPCTVMARRYSHHRHSSPSMLSLETQMSRCHQCCRYGFGHFHYCIMAVHGSHDRHLFLWLQEELEIGLSSVMSLFISIWLCFIYNPLLHIAFLLQERPQNHLDMHHRLDSKGQHQGKLIK